MEKELRIKTSRKGEGCKEDEEGFEGGDPVSPTGQYFNSSALSLSILAILESEVPIDDSQAITLLRQVFLPINPRFSSIMVSGRNGEKRWKRVEIKLEEHVIIPTLASNSSVESYDEQFNEYLTNLGMDPLPQNRPLWEIHLVKYPTTKAAGHLIFKLHHALGDGYSLMGALLSCFQRADDPLLPLTFPTSHAKPNVPAAGLCTRIVTTIPKAIYVAYNTLCDYGWSILKSTVIQDDKTPIRSANKDLEHKPMQISTVEFSLDHVKQIKSQLGVTINDVVTGIIFHGVRMYMRGRSEKWASSHSTALVLMNTRDIGGYKSVSEMLKPTKTTTGQTLWGNQFAFLHTSVPKLPENDKFVDPFKSVYEARRIIRRKRSSLAFKLVAQTLQFMSKCAGPEASAELIHKSISNASMVMTNMVGPVEKMAIANQPVKGLYFMVVGDPRSLEITVLSYAGTLRIGIGVEKNFIDLQDLKSCIQKAFELTYAATNSKTG